MQATKNAKVAIIGKFTHLHDEEYIARSFEMIGCSVKRIPVSMSWYDIQQNLVSFKPDLLLYTKWVCPNELDTSINTLQKSGMRTVCWLFDLYFDYHREHHVNNMKFFRSDYIITTDGGHDHRWKEKNINPKLVRQGIFKDQCILLPFEEIKHELVFVGSDSPVYPDRSKIVRQLGAKWFGKKDTNELRGMALNELYASTRIVIGDSYYSPHYWSNRVVETLGRGGFLIHQEVPGLKEEYPYLVTYQPGNIQDLKDKIQYYTEHEDERRETIIKNYKWVRDNYTCEKQCQKLLDIINQ